MKKIKLLDYQISILVGLPESGMGYQKVNLIFKNGSQLKHKTVLNSEYLLLEDDEEVDIKEIDNILLAK